MYIYIYVGVCTCVYSICIWVHICVYRCVYINVDVYICIYICVHVCILASTGCKDGEDHEDRGAAAEELPRDGNAP